jgi:hypothetical protein
MSGTQQPIQAKPEQDSGRSDLQGFSGKAGLSQSEQQNHHANRE